LLDHTSLIRIIEKRFGVREPNISAFRRRVCGDFTTALRFSGPSAEVGLLTAQRQVFANPAPAVPARNEPVSAA
jgi:phospholipase C